MAFYRRVPANFNFSTTQTAQFANISPDMTLPPGHYYVGPTSRDGWTQPLMMQKGFTHYDRFMAAHENGGNANAYDAAYPVKAFANALRVNDQFGMTTNTSKEQCEAFADQMPLGDGMSVLETQENVNFLPPEAIQWQWFHDRWRLRRDAQTAVDGKPRFVAHNYFRFSGGIFALGQQDWSLHRQLYTTPYASWNSIQYTDQFGVARTATNDWSAGGTLRGCNMITEGAYLGNPDGDRDMWMGMLFAMDTTRMQGRLPGIFTYGSREWRPGFLEGTNYSDGRFVRRNKIKLGQKVLMDLGFMSQEWGRGDLGGASFEWGVNGYEPVSKKPVAYYKGIVDENTDFWKKTGDPGFTFFPYYAAAAGNGTFGFGGGDYIHFGIMQWFNTIAPVRQGTPKFCRFRINGGAWIEKSTAESDLIDARKDRRGMVRGRIHNGKMGFWWQNKYANHTKQILEFQHPDNLGLTITRTVCGPGVHSELLTL